MGTLISLVPLMLMQAIYAIFIALIAKRTNKNVWLYTILSIVPILGMFFFLYVIASTFLRLLDSVNALEKKVGITQQ
ncbi:MAG: hypothetical protein RI918_1786 [Pseudomonadota bacterium]|jgi:hypothetical protein